jgi:hypothetical protein
MSTSSETMAKDASSGRTKRDALTADQDEDLEDLIDRAEFVVGDSELAWQQLQAKVGLRIARRKEWGPEGEAGRPKERARAESLPDRPGGAMPIHPALSAKARRPFVGYDRELEAYEQRKPGLLADAEGHYVVLVGDEMIGPFHSFSEAEAAGYSRFGLGPLFIKQVLAEEPVIEVTRFMAP